MHRCRDRMDQWHWHTMTRQSWNIHFFLRFFGLAEQNCCSNQWIFKMRYPQPVKTIRLGLDIQHNERHADLSDGKIVGTYHFWIRHLGSSTRALIAGAHTQKKEQFSLHKEKAESLSEKKKIELTWIHKKDVLKKKGKRNILTAKMLKRFGVEGI